MNWSDISDPTAARHYLWRHYVEYETMWPIGGPLFLARDDLPRFFEWLFHNLAFAIHQDFRVGVESLDGVPSCAPGRRRAVAGDPPHVRPRRRRHTTARSSRSGCSRPIPREWLRPGDRPAPAEYSRISAARSTWRFAWPTTAGP